MSSTSIWVISRDSIRTKVDLGSMAKKEYSTFPKAPVLQFHHQSFLCHIQALVRRVLSFCRDAEGLFCTPDRLGHQFLDKAVWISQIANMAENKISKYSPSSYK